MLTQSIETSLLKDPLDAINATYRDLLTLILFLERRLKGNVGKFIHTINVNLQENIEITL